MNSGKYLYKISSDKKIQKKVNVSKNTSLIILLYFILFRNPNLNISKVKYFNILRNSCLNYIKKKKNQF